MADSCVHSQIPGTDAETTVESPIAFRGDAVSFYHFYTNS